MSQFDFPRLHFSGSATINPASANNNIFLPLVLFDPIKVRVRLPPRIYLSPEIRQLIDSGLIELPDLTPIMADDDERQFFEIGTVNTPEKFKNWATTPLGSCIHDTLFHRLYEVIRTVRENQPLTGKIPASWNYYGGMEFSFNAVSINSIAVYDEEGIITHDAAERPDCPDDVRQLLGATISLANEAGLNAAVMVDVVPNLAFYTQIFCDRLCITQGENTMLQGRPEKASLRFLNPSRVLNQDSAVAGSGTFHCVIPLAAIDEKQGSPVLDFLRRHEKRGQEVAGVFIRFNLFEVVENQYPDYGIIGTAANPAKCSVLGTISPWYETDMKSVTMGRQLMPDQPFYAHAKLPPLVCNVDRTRQIISLDLVNSIPQLAHEHEYRTFHAGEWTFSLVREGGETAFATLNVGGQSFDQEQFRRSGGILDVPLGPAIGLLAEDFEDGYISMTGPATDRAGNQSGPVRLLKESEYMVASDQPGLYVNQGDDPEAGYRSSGNRKMPCEVRVYHKGKPFPGTLRMNIQELRIKSSDSAVQTFLETEEFRDRQQLLFPTLELGNVIYVFYPGNTYAGSGYLIPDILNTGFFLNLRILPKHNYDKYLNPQHPEYQASISFETIYKEVLAVYDLIYPLSSVITPFREEYFRIAWKFIRSRLSPDNWDSYSYMPTSRDMSEDQWKLLCKWAESVGEG